MSECPKGRNKRIAKTWARVEHPFAQMRHMGGQVIRTIGQVRATAAMTMMAACYNLKRLAKFLDDGVDAFYENRPSKTTFLTSCRQLKKWFGKTSGPPRAV